MGQEELTATQYLLNDPYDIVILDIMGVNVFEWLRLSVSSDLNDVTLGKSGSLSLNG
jgi:hypothetical protein